MVFQDPFSSLNPRKKIAQIVGLPMTAHGVDSRGRTEDPRGELLFRVGLDAGYADRYPHQFSGGQRQRIGSHGRSPCKPELVIADEPISALDVSIQAQILNLLMDLQEEFGLTYLFVEPRPERGQAHQLAGRRDVPRLHRRDGGHGGDLRRASPPLHPDCLFSAIPSLDRLAFTDSVLGQGGSPTPIDLPSGCPFHPRCRHTSDRCRSERPEPLPASSGRLVTCHLFSPPHP